MAELDWIKSELHDRRLDIVAKATRLHVNTIAGIRNGKNKNPTIGTLNKLAKYLKGDAS